MEMYFLKFIAEPDVSSPERNVVARGFAHIWLKADSPEAAKTTCIQYMHKYHLFPLSLELCVNSLDVQLDALGASESALYRRAQQFGIAMDYIASPLENDTGLAAFRPLKS